MSNKVYVPVSVKEIEPRSSAVCINNKGNILFGIYLPDGSCHSQHETILSVTHWLKEVDADDIRKTLRSVFLCLSAHPDNEPDSEFADRIEDLEYIINLLSPNKDGKEN